MADPIIPGSKPLHDWGGWLGGIPWSFVSRSSGGADDGTWAAGSSQEVITINVAFQDEVAAIAAILGYAQAVPGNVQLASSGTSIDFSGSFTFDLGSGTFGGFTVPLTGGTMEFFTQNPGYSIEGGDLVVIEGKLELSGSTVTGGYLTIDGGSFDFNQDNGLKNSIVPADSTVNITGGSVNITSDTITGGTLLAGSSTIGQSTNPYIHWNLPVAHPRYDWLHATRIMKKHLAPVTGVVMTTLNDDVDSGDTAIVVDSIDGITDTSCLLIGSSADPVEGATVASISGLIVTLTTPLLYAHAAGAQVQSPIGAYNASQGIGQGGLGNPGAFMLFELTQLAIQFSSLPYSVLSDTQLTNGFGTPPDESKRFCEYQIVEGAEFLTRERGQFLWAEGNGSSTVALSPRAQQPTKNTPVQFSLGNLLIKPTFVIVWHRVPMTWIMGTDTVTGLPNYIPTNIRNCEGHVNNDTFFGRVPGTLLMLEAVIEPTEEPVNPLWLSLPTFTQPRSYTVKLPFKEFDPPSGLGVYRGHNLAPNPRDNLWYLVTVDGSTTATMQYPGASFGGVSGIFGAVPGMFGAPP